MSPFVLPAREARPSAVACANSSARSRYPILNDFVHVKAVQAIYDILIEFDIDHEPVFEQAGISTQLLHTLEAISLESLGRLTVLAAQRTQCSHFGLLVGQHTTLASLGVLGTLMRHSETIGDALRALETHYGLLNRGAMIEMAVDGPLAIVNYSSYEPDLEGLALHCERALAAITTVLRSLCGPDWSPQEVLLPRRQPPDTTPYAGFFRAPVRFEQEIAALAFPARLLGRPIEDVNPVLREIAGRRIRRHERDTPPAAADEIRRSLHTLVAGKRVNKDEIARTLGITQRTLSRRLKAEGTNYRSVADERRLGIAKQLLADTAMSLAQISSVLEFSEPAAFTHAFRRWIGTTPSAWRKDHRPR